MKICRFRRSTDATARYGLIGEDGVRPCSGPPWDGGEAGGEASALDQVVLTAPVEPSKIIAIGRNYAAHARELGNEVGEVPLVFAKVPSSIIGPEETILLPPESERVDYEGELAIVIGARCRRVPRRNWRDVVFGFTCANDVTARDLQRRDVQFTRGKGFDTFCPVGPWIETDLDPSDIGVQTRVNDEIRQSGRTKDLAFPVPELVEFVSASMTLLPGDLILTGTPEGVGPLKDGDVVDVEVEGVGTLRNFVASESTKFD
ncbi:MAG: fumarylacetoacetate hydrolase family protein [Thermoanaerobaculia bacterium]|nr:fumarylacetoacetate hydrolase family protein [Thermoanaerobaculia bacterium]